MPWLCYSWIAIREQGNNGWADAGHTMLASYGTAVMMASLCVVPPKTAVQLVLLI